MKLDAIGYNSHSMTKHSKTEKLVNNFSAQTLDRLDFFIVLTNLESNL